MQKLIFCISLITLLTSCGKQKSSERTFVIYSEQVKDSFEIYINLPDEFKQDDKYDVFYYLDANLKSGKKLRQFIKDSMLNKKSCKTIYVGVGHIGNYRVLRRRDYIVPTVENNNLINISDNFGQAESFYKFLKTELIPTINRRYNTNNGNNSILGHSFGGLFTIYCLFKNDTLFRNFYSLSPSLWANYYSIYNFNHLPDTSSQNKNLFLSVGSMETINKIKPGADEFEQFINKKHYSYLRFSYKIYQGESHNSQVSHSINDIFNAND
jgi:predicted alpha/beta superfamily hydrolase